MSLREDIMQAMVVASDGTNMALECVRAMDWKISVRLTPRHYILTHKAWVSNHSPPPPMDEATRIMLRAVGRSSDLSRP